MGCLPWGSGLDVFWGVGVHGRLTGRDQSGGWVASVRQGAAEGATPN